MRSIRIRLLHRFGVRLWRRNIGAIQEGSRFVRFALPGQSDLYGVMPPPDSRHVEIEVKAPGKKPTELQLRWLKMMHSLGCVCLWSDNANDAERVMEAVMKGGKVVWGDGVDFWVEV